MNKRVQQKRRHLTLTDYVRRRNGVPLGASGSLQNMFYRSLGAGSFSKFWQYWNPIWGYALGRYIYAPLQKFFSSALALILTFTISGAIHDLVTALVRRAPAFLFTPWFFFMSIVLLMGQTLNIDYSKQPFWVRVMINLTFIISCLMLTISLK